MLNSSIKAKLLTISLVPVIVTACVSLLIMIYFIEDNAKSTSQLFEKTITVQKQELIQSEIETITAISQRILRNSKDLETAKEDIITYASNAKFFNNTGYFFAYEKIGDEYFVVFHGENPELKGTKVDISLEDQNGFKYIEEIIKAAVKDQHFIEYLQKKPTSNEVVKKISYANYIEELNWTIATGVYADDIQHTVDEINVQMDKSVHSLILILVSFTLVSIILLIFLVLFYSNYFILKPLKTFQNGLMSFLGFINKEKEDAKLIAISFNDEIGKMTQTINKNITKVKDSIIQDHEVIENVSAVLNDCGQGILSNKVKAKTSNETINELTQNLNVMIDNLKNVMRHCLDTLHSFENRDYSKQITVKCEGEAKELKDGINNLGKFYSAVVKQDIKVGETLLKNASKLNESVNRLNVSATQQAASLEESAASLEEITQTMRSNSNNIKELAHYADILEEEVTKGRRLADKTNTSMDEINEEVNSISEAITIIDQIAFQTNILSLNAAVEAATAGEAGKGFAVVAQEVRNLASRSAEAAKEIKELVENATSKANDGKKIVDKMHNGYETLNHSIIKTTEIINHVTTNSNEQMLGIEQINSAVSQLDHTTQENASISSSANEIAASVQTLAEEIVEEANKNEYIDK